MDFLEIFENFLIKTMLQLRCKLFQVKREVKQSFEPKRPEIFERAFINVSKRRQ